MEYFYDFHVLNEITIELEPLIMSPWYFAPWKKLYMAVFAMDIFLTLAPVFVDLFLLHQTFIKIQVNMIEHILILMEIRIQVNIDFTFLWHDWISNNLWDEKIISYWVWSSSFLVTFMSHTNGLETPRFFRWYI